MIPPHQTPLRAAWAVFVIASVVALSSPAAPREAHSAHGPDNPGAIEPARRLYAYLLDLSRSDASSGKLVSGHWLGASFKPGNGYPFHLQEPLEIRRHTGKWIGMIDGWICPGEFGEKAGSDALRDCMWYDDMIADYTLWWYNGGIVHAGASFFAPLKDRYAPRLEPGLRVDLAAILKTGTPENKRWRAMGDRMAVFFKTLEARGVPVIFRPFTEAYIENFWYSRQKLGDEGSIRLWIDLHQHLTKTRGCNNILWDFQGSRTSPHYPGDAYVDVYSTRSEYRAWQVAPFQTWEDDAVPMGNAELGDYGASTRTDEKGKERMPWNSWVDTIKVTAPRLAFYTIWYRNWGPVKEAGADGRYPNYDTGYNAMLANPWVLTRDEIGVTPRPPSLRFRPGEGRWVTAGGSWTTQDGRILQKSPKGEGRILFGNTDWTDYSVHATITVPPDGGVGIMGRCASIDIYYLLSIHRAGLTLWRRFNGKFEKLGTWEHDFEPGLTHIVLLSMLGDRIEGHVDTGAGLVRRIEATDDAIPCGCFGFRSYNASAEIADLGVASAVSAGASLPMAPPAHSAPTLEDQFTEVSAQVGLDYTGATFGLAWGDINGDGFPDLYGSNHGARDTLFVNQGGQRFLDEAADRFEAHEYQRMGFNPDREPKYWDTHAGAVLDFDNDGDDDIVVLTGGDQGVGVGSNALFINRGGRLVNESEARGVDYPPGRSRAPLWFDLDHDGRLDLVNGVIGRPDRTAPVKFFRQLADGRFEDITAATGLTLHDGNYAVPADLDGDGNFELIFREQGNKSRHLSIHSIASFPFRPPADFTPALLPWAYDFAVADFDNDLRPDVYLTTLGAPNTSQCQLFDDRTLTFSFELQQVTNVMVFRTKGPVSFELGEWPNRSKERILPKRILLGARRAPLEAKEFTLSTDDLRLQGISPAETRDELGFFLGYDQKSETWHLRAGSPERHNITGIVGAETPIEIVRAEGFEHPRPAPPEHLFLNTGRALVDRTQEAGLGGLSIFGRSVAAGDFDNDGDVDLYIVNCSPAGNLPNVLLDNLGGARFRPVPGAGGAPGAALGMGDSVVVADYDRDGFLDLAVANGDWGIMLMEKGPLQLYRNRGNKNHWLQIDLVGTVSNRPGLGAKVWVTAGGKTQYREQNGGFHRLSHDFRRLHVGLGSNDRISELRVLWPSGIEQTLRDIPAAQILTVTEPRQPPSRPPLVIPTP